MSTNQEKGEKMSKLRDLNWVAILIGLIISSFLLLLSPAVMPQSPFSTAQIILPFLIIFFNFARIVNNDDSMLDPRNCKRNKWLYGFGIMVGIAGMFSIALAFVDKINGQSYISFLTFNRIIALGTLATAFHIFTAIKTSKCTVADNVLIHAHGKIHTPGSTFRVWPLVNNRLNIVGRNFCPIATTVQIDFDRMPKDMAIDQVDSQTLNAGIEGWINNLVYNEKNLGRGKVHRKKIHGIPLIWDGRLFAKESL